MCYCINFEILFQGIWIHSYKNDPNIELGILAGYDKSFDVYVGRFWHAGELLPAKVVKAYGAYSSYEGKEIIKDKDFEVYFQKIIISSQFTTLTQNDYRFY